MQTPILLHKNYTLNEEGYQLKLPLNLETIIPVDDSVRLLSQFVEAMDLTDLYSTYERINTVSPRTLLKIVLYSYMNGDYSSRSMELNCKEVKYSDRLFVTKFNTPINSQIFNEAIERMIKELNLMQSNLEQIEKFGGHTFRHTFATRCIESGIQPKTLQKYLGHATLQMTMDLYVHTTDEHKHEEMKKLEDSTERICSDSKSVDEKFENLIKENDKIIKFTLGA